MKKILLILFTLIAIGAKAQTIPDNSFTPEGKRFFTGGTKTDSFDRLPLIDTSRARFKFTGNTIFNTLTNTPYYYYNGWKPFITDSSGIIATLNHKVDSVTIDHNQLFYWINGTSYGQQIGKVDSLRRRSDSIFSYIGGVESYSYDAGGGPGGGDFSSNTSTSVNGEIVLFSGTGGKTGKRATGTGIAKITSGVLGTAVAGTDFVDTEIDPTVPSWVKSIEQGTSTNQVLNWDAGGFWAAKQLSYHLLADTPNLSGFVTFGTAAGGDLSGIYPNPSVVKIRGVSVPSLSDGFFKYSAGSWLFDNTSYQAAGNYITALTGDITASGPGSVAATLATVNSNVGTWNNVTVNGKGLVTAGSNVSYLTTIAGITAGGDLSGTYVNPSVVGIRGSSIPSLSAGYLKYTGSAWTFSSLPVIGANQGDTVINDSVQLGGQLYKDVVIETKGWDFKIDGYNNFYPAKGQFFTRNGSLNINAQSTNAQAGILYNEFGSERLRLRVANLSAVAGLMDFYPDSLILSQNSGAYKIKNTTYSNLASLRMMVIDTLTGFIYRQAIPSGGGGSGVTSIATTSPITGGTITTTGTIGINDAAADGSTKGAASFTAADFNSSSGNISIDYTNGQAATSSVKGFLTSTDWSTFNGKQAALSGTGLVSFSGTTASYNTTSASIAAILSDETGSGAMVFGTTPTIATPVINGLATGTGVASAATASTLASRDANANISANSFLAGYTTTATAAGTTTLTAGSTYQQYFTGSTTQTVTMPVASTLVLGQRYLIVNNSSGVVTVQSSGSNTIQAMAASSYMWLTAILTSGTGVASWNASYVPQAVGLVPVTSVSGTSNRITSTGGTTPVIDISASYVGQSSITTLGTIGTGTWQGSLVTGTYGGTGVNNGSNTITLANNLVTVGAFALTLTSTATSNATIPAGTNTLYSTKSASITSSQLATSVSDETGTGVAVFGTSPDFTTGATIGGVAIPTISSTNTLTNKRWTARVGSTTSSATPTINTDNTDIYKLTAQAADITSMTTNLSGTPVDGDIIEIEITGTAARAITWGSSFVSGSVALPSTTTSTTTLTVILQYYTTSSYGNNKWQCVNFY